MGPCHSGHAHQCVVPSVLGAGISSTEGVLDCGVYLWCVLGADVGSTKGILGFGVYLVQIQAVLKEYWTVVCTWCRCMKY